MLSIHYRSATATTHQLTNVSREGKHLSASHHAGQAVVQFVVDPRNGAEFAVKFFLQEAVFRIEAALYAACFPSLRSHLSPSLQSLLIGNTAEPSPPYDDKALVQLAEQASACEANTTSSSCSTASCCKDDSNDGIGWGDAEADSVRLQSSRSVIAHPPRQSMVGASAPGPRPDTLGTARKGTQSPSGRAGMHTAAGEQTCTWNVVGSFQQMPDTVAKFLPQVEVVCQDAEDPRGWPLPPCIVMEKGESLQDWSNRAEPDLFASLAVCCPPHPPPQTIQTTVADRKRDCAVILNPLLHSALPVGASGQCCEGPSGVSVPAGCEFCSLRRAEHF